MEEWRSLFLKVSQEAKVALFLSAWPSGATTMSFGYSGCLKNGKKWPFFWDHFELSLKILKIDDIVSQIAP